MNRAPTYETTRRPGNPVAGVGALLLLIAAFHLLSAPAHAGPNLEAALEKTPATELVPGADRYGSIEGDPPYATAWRGDELAGYVFMNTDIASAIGYSGKPIHVLIGLSPDGIITGTKLYRHSEPIVLIGIPEARITEYMARYAGFDVRDIEALTRSDAPRTIDMISGATVTIMVIDDSVTRAALIMARQLGLAGLSPQAAEQVAAPRLARRPACGSLRSAKATRQP